MITTEEISHLASLARITISEQDLPKLTQDFDSILDYISQLEGINVHNDGAPPSPEKLRNVLRTDESPYPKEEWTKELVHAFPHKNGNSLTVKKIISHD